MPHSFSRRGKSASGASSRSIMAMLAPTSAQPRAQLKARPRAPPVGVLVLDIDVSTVEEVGKLDIRSCDDDRSPF